jgi:hypothetical protein
MRPQYSGRIADAGFDVSSNFFYLALTRGEIPPRAAPGSTRGDHAPRARTRAV